MEEHNVFRSNKPAAQAQQPSTAQQSTCNAQEQATTPGLDHSVIFSPQPLNSWSSSNPGTSDHRINPIPSTKFTQMQQYMPSIHSPEVNTVHNYGGVPSLDIQPLNFVTPDRVRDIPEQRPATNSPATSSVYFQAVSALGQSPSAYSRITNMINSPHIAQEVASTVLPTHAMESSPQAARVFKSPSADDSQLVELQTVTPSRISSTAKTICSQTTQNPGYQQNQEAAPSATTPFTSPPAPFRLRAADGSEIKPVMAKTPGGRLSLTYPLSMFVHSRLNFEGVPSISNQVQSNPQTLNCFSQFLHFSDNINQDNSVHHTTSNQPSANLVEIRIQEGEPQTSKHATISSVEVDPGTTEMEIDDEEEERENVEKITKALNIPCDVYKETKENEKKTRKSNKLPKELRGLMGEANLCYARGDHEGAIKMCMEIIREAPYSPDPFETLAMIYDERGEGTKALQYSLLATHLQPADVDQWVRMAESCEEVGFLQQAVHCYVKASKLKPDDYKLRWAAAVLEQQLGNLRRALKMFKSVVILLPETEVMQSMALARDIARACHANNETGLAIEVMEEVLAKHFDHVKYEDVNVMCELALASKQYKKVFDVMARHCQLKVQYESENGSEEELQLTTVEFLEHIPVDLQCKVILACVYQRCLNLVEDHFEEICTMDPADIGDLQFDIAEALIDVEDYRKALHVLDILVSSADYSLAAVWLKKGECHRDLDEPDEEIKCLQEVVTLAPGHTKAYLALCKVLRQNERYEESEEVMEEAETYEMEDQEQMLVNYERFNIYNSWASVCENRQEKLCKAGDAALLMLANKLEAAFVPSKALLLKKTRRNGKTYLGDVRITRRVGNNYYKYKNKKSLAAKGSTSVISNEEWWDLYQNTVNILLKSERFVDGITLADAVLYYAAWYGIKEKRIAMERIAVSASMIGANYSLAYSFIRPWLLLEPNINQLWNLFNQITIRSHDQRHHRFCLRFLVREPENIAVAVLTGHNSLATGTYKHSLGEYIRAHKKVPTEPMFMLLIGVIYTHIASQKFTSHKNSLVAHALAFLNKYIQHRKCDQESCYNMGRSMHQLGFLHFAVLWYKKALEAEPPQVDMDGSLINLRCEIAYNLALTYKNSGSVSLANRVLEDYCVI